MAQGRPKRQRGRSTLALRAVPDLFLERQKLVQVEAWISGLGVFQEGRQKSDAGQRQKSQLQHRPPRPESLRGRWEATFLPTGGPAHLPPNGRFRQPLGGTSVLTHPQAAK